MKYYCASLLILVTNCGGACEWELKIKPYGMISPGSQTLAHFYSDIFAKLPQHFVDHDIHLFTPGWKETL